MGKDEGQMNSGAPDQMLEGEIKEMGRGEGFLVMQDQ